MPTPSRRLWTLAAACLLLAALPGCNKRASVTDNQCVAGDWETLGYRDGVYGHRSTRLLAHHDACVEVGVVPDRETYMRGWREGIAEYCRADNGYQVGLRGARYANVCPEDAEARFLSGYVEGRALYDARRACTVLEDSIHRMENRRVDLEARVLKASASQLDPLLTPSARIERLAEVRRLVDERVAIEHELPHLREELALRRAELADLERVPASPRY